MSTRKVIRFEDDFSAIHIDVSKSVSNEQIICSIEANLAYFKNQGNSYEIEDMATRFLATNYNSDRHYQNYKASTQNELAGDENPLFRVQYDKDNYIFWIDK
jgi:hypothetical protein